LRLFDSKNSLPPRGVEGVEEEFPLLFLHLSRPPLAGIVVARAFAPVYVWPAVRYTGEVLAFPTGAGSKLSEDLETGALVIIDRRSAARPSAQMDEGTKNETD
jgi:hypothetical protein